MVSFTKAAISSAALMALVQFSPAPILGLGVVISIEMGSAAAWVGAAAGVAGSATAIGTAVSHHSRSTVEDVPIKANTVSRVKRSQLKRQDSTQPQMNQLAWQECKTDVQSSNLTFSNQGSNNILVSGLPATCMTLATVMTGQFDEGNPVPMSSDSIQFNNVSDDIVQQIQTALDARGAS